MPADSVYCVSISQREVVVINICIVKVTLYMQIIKSFLVLLVGAVISICTLLGPIEKF